MITDNYIKMCEKAEEIQNIKKGYSNQDFVAYNYGKELKVYVCSEISRYWILQDLIWLPTQEQLQEMIKNYWKVTDIFAVYFQFSLNDWIHKQIKIEGMKGNNFFDKFKDDFNSLLLSFVMDELYNKIWLPKEQRWVEEND